ncbi:hypothetical protein ADZZY_96 [Mycobacterium phage Adzzy]|uniref:hypothetical protein n=1 Tax=Mycobacterium phage Adzzy TaxID=1383059 RepID=UPI000387EBE8|nr:hypothetical protein ADZZY_96 [Mycobacterium phage Adzzy]AGT14344.1 hypothetical protein ADZZY_96 [Mycobacterium phage Adzzy]
MPDNDETRFELCRELRTVAELHKNNGNVEYASALLNAGAECFHGVGDIEDYARILGKAEEAL